MKVIIKTLENMTKHTRGKPGAGKYMFQQIVVDDQPITQETTCRTIHVCIYIYIYISMYPHIVDDQLI